MADELTAKTESRKHHSKRCFISCNAKLGDFNVFNGDDDTITQDYNVFMPNVRISGGVTIGNENLFGACTLVIQGLKIGNLIRLSPGSMLLTKPKDNGLYIGNPAKL